MFSPEELEKFFAKEHLDRNTIETSIQKAQERKRELISLSEHPGFQYLLSHLKEQITARITENLQIPAGIDGVVKMMYVNGEIAGIKLSLDFVNIMISSCQEAINTNQLLHPDEEE